MSYYPTERRGGCMESLSRCCRQAYVYPLDTRKLLYVAGGVVGVILVAVIWSGLSSSNDSSNAIPLQGRTVLLETPLIVGSNFFSLNLRDLVHNSVSKVKFDHDLRNDSVFGSANCASCQTDLPRLQSGLVGSQIWSISVPCNAMYEDAVALTLEQVDAISRLINTFPNNLGLVKASTDISGYWSSKQVGSLLAITSGHSLDGRLPVLRSLYNLGVRVISIASSCSNAWATSYNDPNDVGLSEFGQVLVKEMNRLGIVIDLSEASYKTQLDVLSVTKAPVIFSHAAAFTLTADNRNIKDDVLQQLKTNKGLVMVTFVQKYINTTKPDSTTANASISSVVDHINYIKNKIGVAGVGIGGEFDADNGTYPLSLNDVSTFPVLFDLLGKTWTNRDDLKKLAGENFLRVLKDVEKVAKDFASQPVEEVYALPVYSNCYSDFESRKTTNKTSTTVAPSAESEPSTVAVQTSTVTLAPTAANVTLETQTNQTTPATLPTKGPKEVPQPSATTSLPPKGSGR